MSSFRQQSTADSENEYSALYDGSGTTAGSLMPGGKEVPEKNIWSEVNVWCFVVLLLGSLFSLTVAGITIPLGLTVFLGSILLANVNRIRKKHGRGRVLLTVLRPLVIAAAAGMLLSPAVLLGWNHTQWMYQAKRFVYANGVRDDDYCAAVLPKHLPSQCTDYKYVTQGQIIAQDYRPSMFLCFRTDTETMRQYAEQFRANGMEQAELTFYGEDADGNPNLAPREISPYALSYFDVTDDLREAEVYFDDRKRGAALNYETGLVLFWT